MFLEDSLLDFDPACFLNGHALRYFFLRKSLGSSCFDGFPANASMKASQTIPAICCTSDACYFQSRQSTLHRPNGKEGMPGFQAGC